MSAKIVHIALVGAGFMGENHLRNLISLPDVEVIGIFDSDFAKSKSLAEKYQVPLAKKLPDLMKAADAAVICVPTMAHYAVAVEAIQQRCHVFVEKPFTHRLEEAQSLCQMASHYGVHIQVGHVERFHPVIQTLLQSVRYEQLVMGEFYRYVPLKKRIDADVCLTLMVHDLDHVLHIADRMKVSPTDLSATGQVVHPQEMNQGKVDNAQVHLSFTSSFHVTIHAVRAGSLRKREIILTETDRTWVADLLNHRLDLYTRSHRFSDSIQCRTVLTPTSSPLLEEIKHFIQTVQTDRPPAVSQMDGFRVMKLVEQIQSEMGKRSEPK
ncbi:Gfo/Idh/MocA family protein [Kroppenstedtia sanguinis]|uniref:Gfo/Idh/MocA family protein n=1 Tax=Kroppenstedtia sanguinis TaxID=1380684 RepID=A0ABW4CAV4_9BACL